MDRLQYLTWTITARTLKRESTLVEAMQDELYVVTSPSAFLGSY